MEVPQLYVKVYEAANLNLPFSHGTIRFVLSAPPLELKGTPIQLTNNPKWRDEEFVFHIQDHEGDFVVTLVLEDKNKERAVRLSTVTIPLSSLDTEQPVEGWFDLVPIDKNYTMLFRETLIVTSSAFSSLGPDVTHSNTYDVRDPQRVRLKLHYTYSQGTDIGATLVLMQRQVSEFANLLLYDGAWVVNALCEAIDIADTQRVAQALVRVFEYYKNTRTLLRTVISKEVNTTDSTGTLFRSNSMAMKLLSVYAQVTGQQYLRVTLAGPIADIVADARSVEMDPSKLKPGEDVIENAQHLQSLAQNVLDRILQSIDSVPREIREICLLLRQQVTERFPSHWFIALGGFFFLRYVCPACVAPEGAGIIPDVPDAAARRALVLVTKVLQQLANGAEFAGKEAYMRPMNPFIVLNTPRLNDFFQKLVDIDLDNTTSHLQIRPYMAMSDLIDLQAQLKTHFERVTGILMKNNAPNVEKAQAIIAAFSADWCRKVDKIHNITSEQLMQLGAIKIPSDLRASGGLSSSGGARLKADEETILNDWPIYTGPQRDPNIVAENLLRSILALYTAHTLSCTHSSTKDKLEDRWKHIEQADQFDDFKNDIAELQSVNLDSLSEMQLIAFFVNVFNTMAIHLHVNTVGNLMTKRTGCLLQHKYRIGDSEYSMMDILHLLRSNPKNHITRHRHIRGGDVRRRYVLPKVDPRIHFVLSYLTATDPFVRVISHYTVEEDLIHAGMEYCQKNISVDSTKREVFLPEIFHKYASDFGMAKDDLFIWLFQFLSKDTRMKMVELMEKKFTVTYTPHSNDPQGLPPYSFSSLSSSPFSSPYPSSGNPLSTSLPNSLNSSPLMLSPPLSRHESHSSIEKYSNRVRSSTMGTKGSPPPKPVLKPQDPLEEEFKPSSVPNSSYFSPPRHHQYPASANSSPNFFHTSFPRYNVRTGLAVDTSPSSSLLGNGRSESALAASSSRPSSPPYVPSSPTNPYPPLTFPKVEIGNKDKVTVKAPPAPTRAVPQAPKNGSPRPLSSSNSARALNSPETSLNSFVPPTNLPRLSPPDSPTHSPPNSPPHNTRSLERSVSDLNLTASPIMSLSHSPPSRRMQTVTSSPVLPQRLEFPSPVTTPSTSPPSTPTSKPTTPSAVTSPPPLFLGCVDYYPDLSSPTKVDKEAPLSSFSVLNTSADLIFVPKVEQVLASQAPKSPAKVRPQKTKSATTMSPTTVVKAPPLSSAASASSLMGEHSLTLSPPQTRTTRSLNPGSPTSKSTPNLTDIMQATTPLSANQSQVEPLRQELVNKLIEISKFLRANTDTSTRDVEYVTGLAQILTYMKKQLETPTHTTTGKFQFRAATTQPMDPTKQETLISSVSKAVKLLREKVNDYRRVVEFESEPTSVYANKNICLDDISEGLEMFKTKFQSAT